jgi:hypothetical protein
MADGEVVCMPQLGEDAIRSIATQLDGAADRAALSHSCAAIHASLRLLTVTDRSEAVLHLHSVHCGCSSACDAGITDITDGFEGSNTTSCVWLRGLMREQHLHLRGLPHSWACQLEGRDVRALLLLLRERRQRGVAGDVWSLEFDYPGGISPSGLHALVAGLPDVVPALTHLSLAGCAVETAGANLLADAVRAGRLRRLRRLDLESNPFSPAARTALRRACHGRGVALSAYTEVENESLYEEEAH